MITIPRTKQFSKNYERNNNSETCVICGKAVNAKAAYVHTWLGSEIVSKEEVEEFYRKDPSGSADSGGWPIGPDCLRRNPQIKPYIQ